MSAIKDLAYDIEQLYIEGLHPTMIARELGCPLSMIYDWLESNCLADEDGCGPDLLEEVSYDPHDTINS